LRDFGLTQTQVFLAQQLGENVSSDKAVDVTVTLLPDLKRFEGVSRAQAPQLQMSETTLDFTDFQKHQKKTIDVKLSNTGASILTISSMQMYTGGLKITLDSREIAPGQSTTLKVTGYAAELAKVKGRPRILMITNDPDNAKVVINIKK
jgi:P pilus assembly chaperone PapD